MGMRSPVLKIGIISDTQVRPGVPTDHFTHIGNFFSEKRPDVIIHGGDHFDMPSLSDYDKGKLDGEGKRYVDDIAAGRAALARLVAPIRRYRRYRPRMVMLGDNHASGRIERFVQNNPNMLGKVSLSDLGVERYGFEQTEFLKPLFIEGVGFSHYVISGSMGRPCSSAAAIMRRMNCSMVTFHQQKIDMYWHPYTQQIAMICGISYTHAEKYLGHQGNVVKPGIWMLHEVKDGRYDPMFVSLNFLQREYS